jgi:hypothetical protein
MGNNIPNSVRQEIREREAQQADSNPNQIKSQSGLKKLVNKVFSLFW